MTLLVWLSAGSLGVLLCYVLASLADAWSSLAALAIVLITFQITRLFKVAGQRHVSKMGTAWLTQELRRMAWRMLLTLVLAGIAFKLAWPTWGVAFWLSVAIYYQIGLVLHLRDIRIQASSTENTTIV